VTLTAGGTDADGDEDLASFVWSREIDGHWIVSSGSTLSAPFRLGESSVILTAIDSARAKDMDGTKVTVVDSLAPELAGIDVALAASGQPIPGCSPSGLLDPTHRG
jgi:hypothetical protein